LKKDRENRGRMFRKRSTDKIIGLVSCQKAVFARRQHGTRAGGRERETEIRRKKRQE